MQTGRDQESTAFAYEGTRTRGNCDSCVLADSPNEFNKKNLPTSFLAGSGCARIFCVKAKKCVGKSFFRFRHNEDGTFNPNAPTVLCEGLAVWTQRTYYGRSLDECVRFAFSDHGLDVELPAGANREKLFYPELARTTAATQETATYAPVSKC